MAHATADCFLPKECSLGNYRASRIIRRRTRPTWRGQPPTLCLPAPLFPSGVAQPCSLGDHDAYMRFEATTILIPRTALFSARPFADEDKESV